MFDSINAQNRIFIAFGLLIVVMSLVNFGYSYSARHAEIMEDVNQFASEMLFSTASELDVWFFYNQKYIKGLQVPSLYDEALITDLDVAVQGTNFSGIAVASDYGSFSADTETMKALKARRDYDPTTRDWFKFGEALKLGQIGITDVYFDLSTNGFTTSMVKKVEENPVKILVADLPIVDIEEHATFLNTEVSYGIIATESGMIVMTKEGEENNVQIKDINPYFTIANLDAISSSKNKLKRLKYVKIYGEKRIIVTKRLAYAPWYLLFCVDTEVVSEPLNDVMVTSILVTAIQLLVVLLILRASIYQLLLPLHEVNSTVNDLASGEGDLTIRLAVQSHDEIAQLAGNFNIFLEKMQETIRAIVESGKRIETESNQFNDVATETKAQLSAQQKDISEIVNAISNMAMQAKQVTENAKKTADAAAQSNLNCDRSKQVILKNQTAINSLTKEINNTSAVMGKLEEDTQDINIILSTIQDIAEQTNLLALNAAIEAARAGEQGRGFAVVADEVRVLSQKTHGSTDEIRVMIESLLKNTESAVQTMQRSLSSAEDSVKEANNATRALDQISESINEISGMSNQISHAANEQQSVTQELDTNIHSVNSSSVQMVESSAVVVDMAKELSLLAKKLNDQVGQFKI
jgi:methyl-accepting chemotaxis protein